MHQFIGKYKCASSLKNTNSITGNSWNCFECCGWRKPPVHWHPHWKWTEERDQRVCCTGGAFFQYESISFYNSVELVLIGFELLSRLIPSRNARVFWFFVAYYVCCRFISSRSGRVRWTGQLGKWPGPSSSLFSYLRSIANHCSHISSQSQIVVLIPRVNIKLLFSYLWSISNTS